LTLISPNYFKPKLLATAFMKPHTIIISFVFLLLLALTACKKVVPAGELIQANGFVIDSFKNKKLANVTVYLYGSTSRYSNSFSDTPLDSTISDGNGNFSIKHNADGRSYAYALAVGTSVYGGSTNHKDFVADRYHPYLLFDNSRALSNVEVRARELNYTRVNLKISSNVYDTLYMDIGTMYGDFFLRQLFFGKKIDTSFLTRYLPDATNIFTYRILGKRLYDSAAGFTRLMSDTLYPTTKDTVVISKNMNTTYEIPLKKY
jgi:hypothetical protein